MNIAKRLFPINIEDPPQIISKNTHGDIWIIDDDTEQLEIVSRYYVKSQRRNRMVSINGPEEFEKLIEETSKTDDRPSLILLDINMPGRDGFQVLSDLKKDGRLDFAPIIMFSVSEREADIRKAMASGAYGYLTKPSRGSQYINMFQKI